MKKCSKCEKLKNVEEFPVYRKGTKYQYTLNYCQNCRKQQVYKSTSRSVEVFIRDKYFRTKNRAKKLNIKFDLTPEFIIDLWKKQGGKCFYTGIELIWGVGKGKNKNSMSIDKLIPERGYTKGNIVICSNRINTIKSDMSLEELEKYIPDWYKRIKEYTI